MSAFVARQQTISGWISAINSGILLVLGTCLLFIPKHVVRSLLDYQNVDPSDEEVLGSVTRMAGGAMLAQGCTACILLLQLLWNGVSETSVTLNRISVAVQSVTGLHWVIVGLLDDRVNEEADTPRRETFGLLVVGFAVLSLSCAALMLSFWPAEETETGMSNPDMEPLISGIYNAGGAAQVDEQVEEAANYQILEGGPNLAVLSNDDDTATESETNIDEPTSRIRGTRRLLKLAAPKVVYLYVGCATLLVRLPFSLSIPHFVSTTLASLAQSDFDGARREIFWLFLLRTIDAFLDFWCIFFFGFADLRILRGVRIDTFAAILTQECAFFDVHNSGELTSRLTSDCGAMSGDLTWFFRFSIESVVRITGISAYMLIRSPKLGACALCIVPVVAVVNKYYGDWLGQNARKIQDALAEANSIAQEAFSCIRTVIAFASEEIAYDKYVEKVDTQYALAVRQTFMTGMYYMFVSTFLINTVVQGTLLLIGSYMIQRGNLTGEVLLAFMLYQGQLQSEMMNLFQSYSSLIRSSGAGDKIFALLDRKPPAPATGSSAVRRFEGGEFGSSSSLDIQLENIDFAYPSRPENLVLNGMNLKIEKGKTLALVGPSGSGKSTIVGMLQRLYDPNGGRVLFNDQDIRILDIKALRRRIGVVTQDPALFSGTIASNIIYGTPNATEAEAIEAAKKANAHEFILSFPLGYQTQVGERGTQLSGGQKQRIAIGRAIVRKPALLLLDEATSESEEIVQRALDSLLSESTGVTTVIIAHRLRTVRNADAIAVVNEGRILEMGSHEELMQLGSGYYKEMVEKSLGGTLALG